MKGDSGVANTVLEEFKSWIALAIFIVVGSVVLLNFKDVNGVTAGLNTTIDAFVTGLSEPQNWIVIVVIAIIGVAVLGMFVKKLGGSKAD